MEDKTLFLKDAIPVKRNYSFLINTLSPPKTRKGNPKITAMEVCGGCVCVCVKVQVGGWGLAGDGVPDLPALSTPNRVSN